MQNWNVIEAHETGLDECVLPKAIVFASQNESSIDRDISTAFEQMHFEEPWPTGKDRTYQTQKFKLWRNPSWRPTCQNMW